MYWIYRFKQRFYNINDYYNNDEEYKYIFRVKLPNSGDFCVCTNSKRLCIDW